jgi:hypothetical protein
VHRAAILERDDAQPAMQPRHPTPVPDAPIRLALRPEWCRQHRCYVLVIYDGTAGFGTGRLVVRGTPEGQGRVSVVAQGSLKLSSTARMIG